MVFLKTKYNISGTINVAIRETDSYEPCDHANTVAMSS